MASWGAELTGLDEVQLRLLSLGILTRGMADEDLRELAEEIEDELIDTSPVDTGEYKASWEIREVSPTEIHIVNTASHAKYLVYPNRRMIGSPSADRPAEGIIHNVKGIVLKKKAENRDGLIPNISSLFKGFFN